MEKQEVYVVSHHGCQFTVYEVFSKRSDVVDYLVQEFEETYLQSFEKHYGDGLDKGYVLKTIVDDLYIPSLWEVCEEELWADKKELK